MKLLDDLLKKSMKGSEFLELAIYAEHPHKFSMVNIEAFDKNWLLVSVFDPAGPFDEFRIINRNLIYSIRRGTDRCTGIKANAGSKPRMFTIEDKKDLSLIVKRLCAEREPCAVTVEFEETYSGFIAKLDAEMMRFQQVSSDGEELQAELLIPLDMIKNVAFVSFDEVDVKKPKSKGAKGQ